jgi:signal transduction histidine kinase
MRSDALELGIGLNLRAVHAELDRVRTMFILILPAALLLIAVTGWMIAGRALRPLDSIAKTAEAVTARGLDRRIPVSAESPEIQRVITLLNGMMDRLETSFRQATRFSADASHELKTPLAIMQSELELALQECEAGSPQQRLCGRLLDTVQQLKTITRSLLVLAQADAGQLKLTKEEVNLSDELGDLLEDAHVLAGDKNLAFESHVQPGLIVQADRALLKMAVFNLLSNAVKYSEPNGSTRVELSQKGDLLVLMVGNSGPGIPTEEQGKIFTRFHRARREGDAPVDGLGLGLSLAREVVRAHGGDLKLLESRPGWTAFQLNVPEK